MISCYLQPPSQYIEIWGSYQKTNLGQIEEISDNQMGEELYNIHLKMNFVITHLM